MKTKLVIITALIFALSQTLQAQTADSYVSQGRAFLAATNLTAANNSFANAVTLSPNHQAANVFYAATRLLVLPSQPAGSNFLNRLGVPIAGRDIYNWKALLPKDTNGVPLAPAGVNANESTAMLRTNIFPALVAAEANLAKVTDTNFTLSLTSNETRTVSVTIDYGDVLLLRAMLHAGEYFAYTAYACNLDAELAAIRALYTNEELSIERVLMDYPNLITFTTTNELGAAKLAFQNGTDLYLQASEFIRNRSTNVTRLFNYDAGKAQDEEKFRMTITDLKNSLNGAVPLAVDTNYTVFFSAPFSGAHPLRSFLPDFRENRFVLGTLPDPTFGGLIYGITRPDADAFLAEHLLSVPTIAPGSSAVGAQFQFPINVAKGRGYVVQFSTNLLNWADYAAFVSLGGQYTFTDPNAYGFPRRFYRVEDRTGNMPPPANDDFANRALISGMNVPVTSYTDSATDETGEFPGGYGHTIWWTWTSLLSAEVAVMAMGGSGDWNVTVFTGTSLGSLTKVADGGSQCSFMAQAGTTYQIAVDTWWQDGAVKLVITRPPVLTVTSPPDGAVFPAPANILLSGSASDPDGQIRRVTVSDWSGVVFESTNTSFSFWWTNVPGGRYNLDFTVTDDAGDQEWASRSIRVAPPNDNFTNATPLSGAPLTVTGSNNGASTELGEPKYSDSDEGASVWWSWTAPSSGIFTVSATLLIGDEWYAAPPLGIYTGTSVSNLTVVASNTQSLYVYGDAAQVTFTATAGTTYQIVVDGILGHMYTGDITLKVIPTQPPLVSIVSPTDGSVLVGPTNVTITATATATDGSVSQVDFYQRSTWIGSATNSPYSMVWSNVDAGSYSLTAKATENAGVFTYSAPVIIKVTQPNDSFRNATPISGAPLTITGSNRGADKEPGEPNHAGNDGGASVWWAWTAPSSGVFTMSASSGWDTYLLGIYTGTSVTNLTVVASNTPSFYGYAAQATFTATAGVTYQIAVDGRNGYSGDITLKVIPTQPPLVSIVSPTDGSVLVGPTNVTITADAIDPDGSVSQVNFYQGSTWIGSATNSPYSMVWSNVDAGGYSLTAKATDNAGAFTYSAPVNITVSAPTTIISLDVPVSGISGQSGSQAFYKVTIPSGLTSLQISTSGGTGDCDLYVKHGSQPFQSSWDYSSSSGDNNETVTIAKPAVGDWHIMLYGYSSYSGLTLLVK